MFLITTEISLQKWGHCLQELLQIQQISSQLIGWSKTEFIIFLLILFSWVIQLNITNMCSLCGGPKATYVCHICNGPSTLLEEHCTAMTLEDTRDRKCKGEFHPIHSFWLMPRIKLNCSIKPRKVVEMGYYPCNENILYDLTFCDPLGISIFNTSWSFACYFTWSWYPFVKCFCKIGNRKRRKRIMKGKRKRNRTVKMKKRKKS